MIETVMLTMLGFLAATLLALIVAPAFWHRAVRLTSQRIRNTTPISEAEIRADKDLMRAEYAVRVHQLEREIEKAKLGAHRQFIEVNRRDAAVVRLEGELAAVRADRDEHQNARRVLEQTVNDRLPKLEGRLDEARQLIRARDTAIGELNEGARRQEASLEEARAINAQLSGEVERLKSYLADLGSRDRRRVADVGVETEYALRAEIETLRARSREQAQLIASQQARLSEQAVAATGAAGDPATLHVRLAEQAAEIARLESLLETKSKGAEPAAEAVHAPTLMEKLRATELRLQRQTEETELIRRELDLTRRGPDAEGDGQIRESRALLKARLERMTSEFEREKEQTQRLKAELTAANERAARQAAHHMEEMRHLGARAAAAPRPAPATGSLTVRAIRAAGQEEAAPAAPQRPAQVLTAFRSSSSVRVRELNRAFSAENSPPGDGLTSEPELEADSLSVASPPVSLESAFAAAGVTEAEPEAAAANDTGAEPHDQRGRLLERLRTYEE